MTPKIREALDSPLPVSGLAMKVFATPFKGAAPNASVLLGVELRGRDLRLDPADKVAVTYAVVDTDGKSSRGRHRFAGDGAEARDENARRRLRPPAVEARWTCRRAVIRFASRRTTRAAATPGRWWPISTCLISRSCRSR